MAEVIDLETRTSEMLEEEEDETRMDIYRSLLWLKDQTEKKNIHLFAFLVMNKETGNVSFKVCSDLEIPDIAIIGGMEMMKASYMQRCLQETSFLETPA